MGAMDSTELRVVIVGGGFAGLSCALCMHQRGLRNLVVVEKTLECGGSREDALLLPPYCTRILKGLSLYERILPHTYAMETMTERTKKDTVFATFTMSATDDRFGPSLSIKSRILLNILHDACQDRGIEIMFGTSVTEVDQNDQCVKVQLHNQNQLLSAEFDLLVGADGYDSMIRKEFFGEKREEEVGMSVWSFVAPLPGDLPLNGVHEYPANKKFLRLVQLCGQEVWVQAICPSSKTPTNSYSLRQVFESWKFAKPLFDHLGDREIFFRQITTLPTGTDWCRDRVVLIGDAAHCQVPLGFYGVGMAFEDSSVLADELTRSGSSLSDIRLAGKFYQNRRLPRMSHMRKELQFLSNALLSNTFLSTFVKQTAGKAIDGQLEPWEDSMCDLFKIPI